MTPQEVDQLARGLAASTDPPGAIHALAAQLVEVLKESHDRLGDATRIREIAVEAQTRITTLETSLDKLSRKSIAQRVRIEELESAIANARRLEGTGNFTLKELFAMVPEPEAEHRAEYEAQLAEDRAELLNERLSDAHMAVIKSNNKGAP